MSDWYGGDSGPRERKAALVIVLVVAAIVAAAYFCGNWEW